MMFRKSVAAFAVVLVLGSTLGLAGVLTARLDRGTLDRDVRKILADHVGPIKAWLWGGGPDTPGRANASRPGRGDRRSDPPLDTRQGRTQPGPALLEGRRPRQ